MNGRLQHVVALGIAILYTDGVRADLITYQFDGTVDGITDTSSLLPGSIHAGSTVIGTFSFDRLAPGSNFYHGIPVNMAMTATVDGTYTFTLNTPIAADEIDVFSNTFGFYKRGPDITTGFDPTLHVSQLEASNIVASTNNLATAALSLQTNSAVGITNQNSLQSPYGISVHLTSLSVVPEPSSLALAVLGILPLAVCWIHRRKARSATPQSAN